MSKLKPLGSDEEVFGDEQVPNMVLNQGRRISFTSRDSYDSTQEDAEHDDMMRKVRTVVQAMNAYIL